MNKEVVSFIKKQTAATVCTSDAPGNPYCFSCFYAFDAERKLLYYKTHGASHHAELMLKRFRVAGTILPDKLNRLIVKGVQFEGEVLPSDHPDAVDASKSYHARYRFALALPGVIWTLRLDHVKMTDSSRSFGQKTEWYREQPEETALPSKKFESQTYH